jgi:predicted acetyltransferase
VLEARDELLDKNSARYSIRWDYPIIEVEQTIKEPDIRLDIKDLSQLVTGYQTVRALIEAGKVELSGKIDQVDSLFTYKKLYINDKF